MDHHDDIETIDTPAVSRSDRRWRRLHDSILDAVFELVSEQRSADIAVTEVAERADIAQGTFYNHFRDFAAAFDEAIDRDLHDYDAAVEMLAGTAMDAVERWAVQTGVIVHRLLRQPGWVHFSGVAYRTPRWPRTDQPSASHASIEAGIAEGSMTIADSSLAYHLTHHLKLAVADRIADGDALPLAQTLDDVLRPGAEILGVDATRVDEILEWLVPAVGQLDWTRPVAQPS